MQQRQLGEIRPSLQLTLFDDVPNIAGPNQYGACRELAEGDRVVNRYWPFGEAATVVYLHTITHNTEYPAVEVEFWRNGRLQRTNMFEYQLVKVYDAGFD